MKFYVFTGVLAAGVVFLVLVDNFKYRHILKKVQFLLVFSIHIHLEFVEQKDDNICLLEVKHFNVKDTISRIFLYLLLFKD